MQSREGVEQSATCGERASSFFQWCSPLPPPALEPADSLIPISLAHAVGVMLPKGDLLHKSHFKSAQRGQKEEANPPCWLCLFRLWFLSEITVSAVISQRPSHGGLPLCSSNNKPCQQTDSPADKTWELQHITHVDGFQGCTRRE